MLRKLQDSALNKADAKLLKFQYFAGSEMGKELPDLKALPGAGFVIPYFNLQGKLIDFYRYRYLEEPKRTGFDAITKHKASRYIQPAGAKPRAYFPPLIDWVDLLKSKDPWFVITEGELKAACAAKKNVPCLGLGGVWNFKTPEQLMIKDLADLPWENANVFIVFDSDAATNGQVVMAENALAKELIARKALVHIVRIPPSEDGKKVGLDDYIVKHGIDKFNELLDATPPWERCRMLHNLNEKVIFVHDPGTVIERKSGQPMTPPSFTSTIYANFQATHN